MRTVGIFVALAVAWLLVVAVVRAASDHDSDSAVNAADPARSETGAAAETATVYPSHEEGCAALNQTSPNLRTSEAKAMKDRDALADSILGGEVTMVGLTRCVGFWAVSIGVSTPTAAVPAFGPRGTPVVATVAGPFFAY